MKELAFHYNRTLLTFLLRTCKSPAREHFQFDYLTVSGLLTRTKTSGSYVMCYFDHKSVLISYPYFEGESSSELINFRLLDACFAFSSDILSSLFGAYIAPCGFHSASFVDGTVQQHWVCGDILVRATVDVFRALLLGANYS